MSTQTLHGVNLGGWLVLEKWVTPSLFVGTTAVDEFTFMQTLGAAQKIEQHRKTFVTEIDFQWLHNHGVTAVRIPVGYWVLESDGPFVEAVSYLDWAMHTAGEYAIQVIIDLHGLKGSQNGRDHSGKVGKAEWFEHATYREETLVTLEKLAERYKDYDNFWGLQIINEPKLGLFHCKLRGYYKAAYQRLSTILRPHTRIIYSDAFTPRLLSGALGGNVHHPVAMDIHLYHMTTLFSQYFSVKWFLAKTHRRKNMLRRLAKRQPLIIGEWSGVMRSETTAGLSAEQRLALFKAYAELQLEIYEGVAGWFYWNYKAEGLGQWDFRSEVEAGNIGQS